MLVFDSITSSEIIVYFLLSGNFSFTILKWERVFILTKFEFELMASPPSFFELLLLDEGLFVLHCSSFKVLWFWSLSLCLPAVFWRWGSTPFIFYWFLLVEEPFHFGLYYFTSFPSAATHVSYARPASHECSLHSSSPFSPLHSSLPTKVIF